MQVDIGDVPWMQHVVSCAAIRSRENVTPSFEPQLIGKHEGRFTGFDDKIVAMYAHGMSVREIQGFLAAMYSVDVSPDLISSVTDAVMSEVTAWQSRPLESMYPVVFFDALRVKIGEDAVMHSKAVYLAQGVLPDGTDPSPHDGGFSHSYWGFIRLSPNYVL